ncbi:MAG: DUF6036 family nucleotidyltransferase, partial [Rhabdochlamydiaceae bacterium]
LWGFYAIGVRGSRRPEEIEIYAPLTKVERSQLNEYMHEKYGKIASRRTDQGTSYVFPRSCRLEVNRVDNYVETYRVSGEWEKNRLEISEGVFVLVPQIEDLIIMKLLTARTRDMRDVRHALRTFRSQIDMNKLANRAKDAGVDVKLRRLERVASN